MKKAFFFCALIFMIVILQVMNSDKTSASPANENGNTIQLQVSPKATIDKTMRIGINLGTRTSWGAEQFANNILLNPGFEGAVDRVIVIVSQADQTSFSDEPNWGYDDNHWNGATYEVRSGKSAGTIGTIKQSIKGLGGGRFPQYITESPPPPLAPKDIIVLTKKFNFDTTNKSIPLWWFSDAAKIKVDANEARPGSTGTQSALLIPDKDPSELDFYLDAITERAGKLLVVSGPWRLSFWARADTNGAKLQSYFKRLNQSSAFISKTIPLTTSWQEYSYDFTGEDPGPPQTLKFAFVAMDIGKKIWLDDIYLGPVPPKKDPAWRKEVVDMLKQIRPSVIRDHQGQLGDTLENRLADSYARKATYSRAFAGAPSAGFLYSIPELIDLCKIVKANPWIVIPPTINDREAFQLGQYLALNANESTFSQVYVEFGNENWNWLFRADGIPYPEAHGIVAEKVFQSIEKGAANQVNLKKVVNGQYVNPQLSLQFASSTPSADILGIAPYFFTELERDTNSLDNLNRLFQNESGLLKQTADGLKDMNKGLAVYEVNLHTTMGNAPAEERDPYTAGAAAGAALAKRLIEGLYHNAQPELVYDFAQYDSYASDIQDFVKLWGIARDLSPTNRLRPTGLAVVMLNKVIGGSLHSIEPKDPNQGDKISNLTLAAFEQKKQWTAAIVSSNPEPTEILLTFPEDEKSIPGYMLKLDSRSPFETNENEENVKITKKKITVNDRTIQFTVPPWGFVVLF